MCGRGSFVQFVGFRVGIGQQTCAASFSLENLAESQPFIFFSQVKKRVGTSAMTCGTPASIVQLSDIILLHLTARALL